MFEHMTFSQFGAILAGIGAVGCFLAAHLEERFNHRRYKR